MSKATDKMLAMTSKIKAKAITNEGNPEASKATQLPAKPATGPGIFMQSTFGREAAEQALKDAQQALEDLRKSKVVKISDLILVEGRRRVLKPEEYQELKSNLANNRLINPVTIRNHPSGKYELVSGYNRTAIYEELGRDEIEANLLEIPEGEVVAAAFYTNLLSPSLSHYQQFKGFTELQEATRKTQVEIAKESGLSESHISNILAYEGLPIDCKELLDIKPWILGSAAAAKMSSAVKEGKGDKVSQAVKALFDDESMKEKAALALVYGSASKPVKPQESTIKVGQKKFAGVTSRGGVISLKFADGFSDPEIADKWAAKIVEFVRKELAEESEK